MSVVIRVESPLSTGGVTAAPQGTGCMEGVRVVIERDITMSEAARRLGVSRRTLLRHLREGRIPTAYQSEGGRWYIQPSGIAAWLEERGK